MLNDKSTKRKWFKVALNHEKTWLRIICFVYICCALFWFRIKCMRELTSNVSMYEVFFNTRSLFMRICYWSNRVYLGICQNGVWMTQSRLIMWVTLSPIFKLSSKKKILLLNSVNNRAFWKLRIQGNLLGVQSKRNTDRDAEARQSNSHAINSNNSNNLKTRTLMISELILLGKKLQIIHRTKRSSIRIEEKILKKSTFSGARATFTSGARSVKTATEQ